MSAIIHGGQRRALEIPPELELQVAVNLLTWMLETELWSSTRAVSSTPKERISLAHERESLGNIRRLRLKKKNHRRAKTEALEGP